MNDGVINNNYKFEVDRNNLSWNKMIILKFIIIIDKCIYIKQDKELTEGAIGEIQSQDIVKEVFKGDFGVGEHFGGKNEDEDGVNNIIDAFKYAETQFTKANYTNYIKNYAKKVKAYLKENKPNRVTSFQKGANEFVKWVYANFNDLQLQTIQIYNLATVLESYNMNNHIIIGYYKEGQTSPDIFYILDGLKEVKM